MFEASWTLFLLASVAVILTPGQDLVLVMSRSLAQGSMAGIVTAAGVSCGLLLHTVLATVGVGAIVKTSAWLFVAMKIVGGLYLLYLGLSLLRATATDLIATDAAKRSLPRLFADGAISNVANPKIALFYFAFLPQFVLPTASNTVAVIFSLGVAFALLTFIIKGPVGYFAGRLSAWLRANPRHLIAIYRASGLMLIFLSVRLFLVQRT